MYRMPDGTCTEDGEAMCNAWAKMAEPIEKATGTRAIGFDPGIQFYDPTLKMSSTIPLWMVELLNKALVEKNNE